MKDLLREMFFGFIAIAMAIELIGGDLFCLLFAIDRVVELLDVSQTIAYRHMLSLFFWNAVSVTGAGLVCFSLRHPEYLTTRRWGVVLTAVGLCGYAAYQYWFSSRFLGDRAVWVQGVSSIYAIFGLVTLWISRDLLLPDWVPEQPVQKEESDDTATVPTL